ncbi:MAG: SprT-like domain-containing protein, partial [Ruminiclostridium sp.]|nr:SprT-like domain-containing protein [Ruminiclostridium sp.]
MGFEKVDDKYEVMLGSAEFSYKGCIGASAMHISCNSSDEDIVIPSKADEKNIICLDTGSCICFKEAKKITIAEGIRSIDTGSFQKLRNLEEVYLPDSIDIIRNEAFLGCSKLKKINIPDNISCVEVGAFDGCIKLKSVTYKDKTYCFSSLAELYSLFSERPYYQDENFLYGYNGLFEGYEVLKYFGKGKEVTVPSIISRQNVRSIGFHAFSYNRSIVSVRISEGIIGISTIFDHCSKLEEIYIPDSVKYISSGFFTDCRSIKRIIHGTQIYYECNTENEVIRDKEEAIEELSKAFDILNKHFFNNELPKVEIYLSSRKRSALGFAVPIFNEIALNPIYFDTPPIFIMEVLIHEMCHIYASEHNIDDCNSKQYHNENFKFIAEHHGLAVGYVEKYGYASTYLTLKSAYWIIDNVPIKALRIKRFSLSDVPLRPKILVKKGEYRK